MGRSTRPVTERRPRTGRSGSEPADDTATVAAVKRFLAGKPEIDGSPEAAGALAAARMVDDASSSTTSRAMALGRYQDALQTLRMLAPAKAKESPLDQIRAQREKRIAAAQG